jgi:hypothetical protein
MTTTMGMGKTAAAEEETKNDVDDNNDDRSRSRRSLVADYKKQASWQQDYASQDYPESYYNHMNNGGDGGGDDHDNDLDYMHYETCLNPIQGCTLFEMYNTSSQRALLNATEDFCPPTPHCDNSKIECIRLGTYCRNRFQCSVIGDRCCINCLNL